MRIEVKPAEPAPKLDALYSTNQIGERFGVSRLTVMNWIYSGKIKALRIGGRWKVTAEELARFINTVPEWGVTAQKLRTPRKVGRPPKPKQPEPDGPKLDRRKFKADAQPDEF